MSNQAWFNVFPVRIEDTCKISMFFCMKLKTLQSNLKNCGSFSEIGGTPVRLGLSAHLLLASTAIPAFGKQKLSA